MRTISLVIAMLLAGSSMLPAQLPNPLGLPDPLGVSKSRPSAPDPGFSRQEQRPEEGRRRYKRRHPRRYDERPRLKRRKRGY